MNKAAAHRHSAGAANSNRRFLLLGILGLAAVSVAWGIRANILAKRRVQADLAAQQRSLIQQGAMQIADMRKAVAMNPGNLQAHQALAALYQRYNMPDLFLGEIETLARLEPRDQTVQLTLASTYGALKKWPQAIERYLAIVKAWPDSAPGWQGLSVTFYSLKQYQRAMWAAQHALHLQPDDPRNRFGMAASSIEWAIQSSRMGLHSEVIDSAQQELTKLLPEWPDKAGIHFLLGRAYTALNKMDLAVQHLEEANRLQPDSPDIAYGLGHLYLRQQRRAEGRKVVERALTAYPDNADLVELLGQLWQDSGEPGADAQTLVRFEQAARLASKNPAFQERLGSATLRANNIAQARLAFETAIRLDPNRPYPYQQLAVIYTRLGDKPRAAKIAEAAREMEFNAQQLKHLQSLVFTHPKNVALHLALADRYRDLGLRSMAQDEYLEAKQLDPKNAHADKELKAFRSDNFSHKSP
jgi:tetratricopeptide (TPR) repeat protein